MATSLEPPQHPSASLLLSSGIPWFLIMRSSLANLILIDYILLVGLANYNSSPKLETQSSLTGDWISKLVL